MEQFEHQLRDGVRIKLDEFDGRRLLHIRRYVNDRPTATGIAIPENLMLRLLDTETDFQRAYEEQIGLILLLNDYIQMESYPSGKLDIRYYNIFNGQRVYLKKGITLAKHVVDEMYNVLHKEMAIKVIT